MRLRWSAALACVVALLGAACSGSDGGPADADGTAEGTTVDGDDGLTYPSQAPAPEFPAGLEWFNTDGKALTIQGDLHGKVVVLDFWTSGCINCLHIIPDLQRLEEEFGDALAVVGVHSAKFTNEATAASVRDNVVKNGVTHPVVNDRDMAVWDAYGARAWPTTVVVDPRGGVVGGHEGEGVYEQIQPVIATLVEEYDALGEIDRRPLSLVLEAAVAPPTVLSYPGEVLADPAGGRLFIADTGHDRILEASLDGALRRQIGAGTRGLVDGPAASAQFAHPQGLALSPDGTALYVADTANHAVRRVDLATGDVETIAGSGRQAQVFPNGERGREVALASPWDVAVAGRTLFIAMAGVHQIWTLDLEADFVKVFAGSGGEGIADGLVDEATLAQPSALAVSADGRTLFFTDPESSAVRQVPTSPGGNVETIVGTGLFDFGDVDGGATDARLQHPLGLAVAADGQLLVADTYNDKLKLVDPLTRTATTFAGTGQPGLADGPALDAQLAEPAGLSFAGSTLYVADAANHVIRTVDVRAGEVATLVLSNLGVADPAGGAGAAPVAAEPLPAQTVAAGDGALAITFRPPDGYVVNALGPFSVTVTTPDPAVVAPAAPGADPATVEVTGPTFPVSVPLRLAPGTTTVEARGVVYYCREGNQGLCLARDYALAVPVTVTDGAGAAVVEITRDLPAV
jgi:sugar lactone lactonase YvrE/thiol-disulfide isomerase/thioredoxin